jgi:hypothetical protein
MTCLDCPECDHYLRLPGLFRRSELVEAFHASDELHVKLAGEAADGMELYRVYCREQAMGEEAGR